LETSKLVHEFYGKIEKLSDSREDGLKSDLKQVWRWLLMAEASDYFWWGAQDWLNQAKICCMKAKEKIEEN
jgi:alpha-amylase/alpha-mannosidase (GH57 family)